MDHPIELNESNALERRVPVYLVKPDGTPVTSTSGLTVQYQKPGGSLASATLVADGPPGGYYIQLGSGDVDTAGEGWVYVVGAGLVVTYVDTVAISTRPSNLSSRLPAALASGNMIAKVMDIDSTIMGNIAGAVWDAVQGGHLAADSFGQVMAMITCALNINTLVDNTTFGTNNMGTAWRRRSFDTAAHANAATPGATGGSNTGERINLTGSAVDETDGGKWSSLKETKTYP